MKRNIKRVKSGVFILRQTRVLEYLPFATSTKCCQFFIFDLLSSPFAADKQRHAWPRPLHNHIAHTSLRPGGNENGLSASGRKNVMSMRDFLCPDPLAGFEKMAGFQIFHCL